MCVNAVIMATKALVVITMRYQLTALRYVDDSGQAHPVTFRVLIQVSDSRSLCMFIDLQDSPTA